MSDPLATLATAIEVRRAAAESAVTDFQVLFQMASRTGKSRMEWCLTLTDLPGLQRRAQADAELIEEMRQLIAEGASPLANEEQMAQANVARSVVRIVAKGYDVEIGTGEL